MVIGEVMVVAGGIVVVVAGIVVKIKRLVIVVNGATVIVSSMVCYGAIAMVMATDYIFGYELISMLCRNDLFKMLRNPF